jgi:hypothetical protein
VCIDRNRKANQNVAVPSFCRLTPGSLLCKNTNVGKLYDKIDLETTLPKQHAFYRSGFGKRPEALHIHILNNIKRAFNDFDVSPVAWFVPLATTHFEQNW